MTDERSHWALAAEALARNWPLLAAITVVQAALQWLQLSGMPGAFDLGATVVRGWLQIPILYLATWTMVRGGRRGPGDLPWPGFLGVFWRLVVIGLPAGAAILLAREPGPALAVALALAAGSLALFGTVLPDRVAGRDGSLRKAAGRGLATLKPFVLWMLAGPVAATVGLALLLALAGGAGIALAMQTGVPLTVGEAGSQTLAGWVIAVLALAGSAVSTMTAVLVAAVLTRLWRRACG